jgi:hypothetical protein
MCGIKFWKDNENLRSVYKKTVFRNFERFLPFLTFSVLKKSLLSLLRDENFFFEYVEWGIKNPYLRTDFKNVHMTLVKSMTHKKF